MYCPVSCQFRTMLGYFDGVREEDYATGLRQQRALMGRPNAEVIFGRNEGGGHRFHGFVERLLQPEDADLPSLFTK